MATRIEELAEKIEAIYQANKEKIDALLTKGPKGGTNARHIRGWCNLGNGVITRAANLAGLPTMNYWSGSNPTPSTAVPTCIARELENAYRTVFN